ncbi:MAG: short-chain dehydrogenase [Candidatus Handelsmanbacteria bacterium RIFCSPLOWO2_12_FULL_64_10]|uniref:Short-chain dehydrogenase n=1 Tax=Handelsmanbacteria sp. (strain RIFCSPLOWO2_12_FULL_64_10) TaxID=1817868 RepID=A0A1F6D4E1_HANXR|nr:MAG: short-chain dehydrogenase [Candidatus Handelsmanbacteria bacterium RIFCSPLOWO2_12_FULL_64_10]
MDLELSGKTAIVTGGSRGIGKAIARQLALEGVDVVIAARGAEALNATAKELAAETGRRILWFSADTRSDDEVHRLVAHAIAELGHVDILVNCAAAVGGQAPAPSYLELNEEDVFEEMNTKVLGYLRCAREVAPHMKERGWGRIISLSGMAARTAGRAPLGTMRNMAVVAMTKTLADDLGPHGINVTVVHPGTTRTEGVERMIASRAEAQGTSREAVEAQIAQGNSVKRLIDARDIANIVTFLASPKSVAINGDAIAAAGGIPGAIYY